MRKQIFASSVGFVMLVLVVMAGSLMAQVGTGSIMGTVTDSTGAVLVGASVTITDAQTGVVRQMASNGAGLYVAPDLNVGVYNIEVKAKGFTGQRRVGVELQVGRQMEVDFSLAPGAQNETVTVQGVASQVETTTSEVSAQVGQSQMRELPLNGRDFEQLILLAPWCSRSPPASRIPFMDAPRHIRSRVPVLKARSFCSTAPRSRPFGDTAPVTALLAHRLGSTPSANSKCLPILIAPDSAAVAAS